LGVLHWILFGLSVCVPAYLARYTSQNPHIGRFQAGPAQHLAQSKHHMFGVLRLKKSDVEQCLLEMVIHSFDLLQGSQLWDASGFALQVSKQEFIAYDHDGLRKVNAAGLVLRGDAYQELAELQIIVDQSRIFRTEQYADLLFLRMIQDSRSQGSGSVDLRSIPAALSGRSNKEANSPESAFERSIGPGGVENDFAAFRQPVRLFIYFALRSCKNKPLQTHVEHSSGGRSDIPRILGANKDNRHILNGHKANVNQVPSPGLLIL